MKKLLANIIILGGMLFMVGCGTQSSDVDGRNSETEIISEINTQQETVNIENETEEENMKEEELYYMPEDYVTRRNDTLNGK